MERENIPGRKKLWGGCQAECCQSREKKGGAGRCPCPMGHTVEFDVILGALGPHDKGSEVG